ncbi:MAG: hypothetical protein BGP13_08560 [Sphingobacteriales bacterium 40-81]|nr:MAG: hypothetical protein BGP13_08560 [Sphingobacteriales bacterium 40-81]
MKIKKQQQLPDQFQRKVARKEEDLALKNQLLSSPELFITEKGSDEYLDKLALKVKLIGGDEFTLSDYISEVMAEYESKFKREWWYRLADLYNVSRSVMDKYVKPEFARQFLVQFVYGRFPQSVLKMLRSKNRKISSAENRTKLFQHLTKKASEQLDLVIEQVFIMMGNCNSPMEFKLAYSKEYKIYFQLELSL